MGHGEVLGGLIGPPPMLAALTTWITPVWILGMGALAGLAVLLLLWAALAILSRKAAVNVAGVVRESVLWRILCVVVLLAILGIVTGPFASSQERILTSLRRLNVGQTTTQSLTIKGPALSGRLAEEQRVPVSSFRHDELWSLNLTSQQDDLTWSTEPQSQGDARSTYTVPSGEAGYVWRRGQPSPFPDEQEEVDAIYVRTTGDIDTTAKLIIVTDVVHPQVRLVPMTAVSIVVLFLLYLAQRFSMPKVSAIALSTSKSEISQPLFLLILVGGIVVNVLLIYVPYNTFGEDIKMYKDSGLTLIMVLCALMAVWSASTSIADEIEGRTALTVLSKPISRWQFILGKFLGIVWSVAVLFIVLGTIFLIAVSFKVDYDARESAKLPPVWQECYVETVRTVPGLVLAFMETVVLASVSVAISTRLPMLANFIICFSIYVMGHLTPLIVESSVGQFEPVEFVGQLIAMVIPMLDNFNIYAAVAAGRPVPYEYLGWCLLYCVLYSTIAMLLALALFEDRDLA